MKKEPLNHSEKYAVELPFRVIGFGIGFGSIVSLFILVALLASARHADTPRGAQLLMTHPRPLLLTAPPAPAAVIASSNVNMRLAWDAVAEPGVAGYRLYYGTNSPPATFQVTNNVGNVTTAVASNLVRGAVYYFAMTDYLTNGLESEFSTMLALPVPYYPPATNILTLSVRVWSRPSIAEPWRLFYSVPVWTGTNTTDIQYFQCDLGITQTNIGRQVLQLDSHTLVVTNRVR